MSLPDPLSPRDDSRSPGGGPFKPEPDSLVFGKLKLPSDHPLVLYITGLTENIFMTELGIADPALIGHVSRVILLFTHADSLWTIHDNHGEPIKNLPILLTMAHRHVDPPEEAFAMAKHVGDLALFTMGIMPDLVRVKHYERNAQTAIDVCSSGKEAYALASVRAIPPFDEEAPLLRQVSQEFELCCYGMNAVRREFNLGRA
jgi:hypothetical protein